MSFKVVYNACFGGFSLSDAAVRRYAEIKGLTVYCEKSRYDTMTYYTVPPEERCHEPTPEQWAKWSMERRQVFNEACKTETLYDRDIPRDDPALIQVVEELGRAASGKFANLQIAELPDDMLSKWHIHEYDGNEHVAEDHRVWL